MLNKSFLRWCLAVGAAGGATAISWLGGVSSALALPNEQILQRLQTVPVFTITDANNSPLVAQVPELGNVAGVFMNPNDAEAFLARLKAEKPELANQVQIQVTSLSNMYQIDPQPTQRNNQENGIDVAYVPTQSQVRYANQLLGLSGDQSFQGVPLFVAKGGAEQGYLTLQQNNQAVIPFFFDQASAQKIVDKFKEQQPDLANTVTLEVVPLEGVLNALATSNNAELNKIMFVPSAETLEYLERNSQ